MGVGVGSTETTERIGNTRSASPELIGAKGVSAIGPRPNVLSLLGEVVSCGFRSCVGSRNGDLCVCRDISLFRSDLDLPCVDFSRVCGVFWEGLDGGGSDC